MICPNCGCEVTFIKRGGGGHRSCFGCLLHVLLAICTCGLSLVISALINHRKRKKYGTDAVCLVCGSRWHL